MRPSLADSQALWFIAVGVAILTVLVILLLMAVFIHHFWSDRVRARNRRRFQQAAELLTPYIIATEDRLIGHVREALYQYGERAVGLVLRRARLDLSGESADRLSRILEDIGVTGKLAKQARSRKEWKRVHAIKGLGECGGSLARQTMMEAASDESAIVRRAAREGLVLDGHAESVRTAVNSFLGDLQEQPAWRHAFYGKMATMAPDALLEMIEAGKLNPEELKLALEALADAAEKRALKLCLGLMRSSRPELRATAARTIGRIGTVLEIPTTIAAMEDDKWFVRAAAARSLETLLLRHRGEVADSQISRIANALSKGLVDQGWWVRSNSARALLQTGQYGIDVLIEAAEGDDEFARDAALAALAMTRLSTAERHRVEAIISRLRAVKEEGGAGAEA